MTRLRPWFAAILLLVVATPVLAAQEADSSLLTVHRVWGSADFRGESFGPARWLKDGAAYTTLEKSKDGSGRDIVRYDTKSGDRTVLVTAANLTPKGDTTALSIEGYSWSDDMRRLLVYTNSARVWRQNTRGDYWVLDRETGALRQLGGPGAEPSTLMFAKFSPDGGRVGYVRKNDLYVEDLATGTITRLTRDGSRTVINGTFDWVYEEELGLRDGWRWSPDGSRVAYWQLNADSVRDFALVNTTDSLYAQVEEIQYPKAGESNSAARVGVVPSTGGATTWIDLAGDPRNHYPARVGWASNSTELYIERLNRLQNTSHLLLADARTGAARTILTEQDSAWVEVVDDITWVNEGKNFLWLSERDGWNHAYLVSRDGRSVRLLTPGDYDIAGIEGVDAKGGWLYYRASPGNPTQRYLYRARLDGKGRPERLTPERFSGTNSYDIAPGYGYAFHTHSSFGDPPVMSLITLPKHEIVRTLVENRKLHDAVAALRRGPQEFVKVKADSQTFNAWVMKPVGFDASQKYPILFYVYGGPGSQTVLDSWGAANYLWYVMLTQRGYAVASVDNRGTGMRGRDWRKIIYGRLGVVETKDQAAAARAIGQWPWVDQNRMGIWGWSYGGFMTLNAMFRAPDVYRAGVAVAPVTHWKYYDNIYTERYNGLPQTNAAGYDAGSPLSRADSLRGDLLVVHGSGDDNVHFQNTEALLNALVKANKQFQFMEYPNRTHSIAGGNTREHLFTLITRYLDEHLRNPRSMALTP